MASYELNGQISVKSSSYIVGYELRRLGGLRKELIDACLRALDEVPQSSEPILQYMRSQFPENVQFLFFCWLQRIPVDHREKTVKISRSAVHTGNFLRRLLSVRSKNEAVTQSKPDIQAKIFKKETPEMPKKRCFSTLNDSEKPIRNSACRTKMCHSQ